MSFFFSQPMPKGQTNMNAYLVHFIMCLSKFIALVNAILYAQNLYQIH